MLNLSIRHGKSLDEARARLEMAVNETTRTFGPIVQKVAWTPDRSRVRLDGPGFWLEMWVDALEVHATGDIPFLGGLLGGPAGSGLKQIVERVFQKKLP